MSGMVKQLVEAQGQTKEKYLELEEKKMRMEERLMEKEMQQQLQQFQLLTMQMMSSMTSGSSQFLLPMSTSTQYPQPQSHHTMVILLRFHNSGTITKHIFS